MSKTLSVVPTDAFLARVTEMKNKIKHTYGSVDVYQAESEEGLRWAHILLHEDALDPVVVIEEQPDGVVDVQIMTAKAQILLT